MTMPEPCSQSARRNDFEDGRDIAFSYLPARDQSQLLGKGPSPLYLGPPLARHRLAEPRRSCFLIQGCSLKNGSFSARESALVPSAIVHDAQAKSRRIEKNLKINDEFEYSRKMVENPGDLRVRIRPMVQFDVYHEVYHEERVRCFAPGGRLVRTISLCPPKLEMSESILARCDSFGPMIR
jgi:hypothetical protein